jgi:hypothetical protein
MEHVDLVCQDNKKSLVKSVVIIIIKKYQLLTSQWCLMFVPCIIRRGRNNQQYALICTTSLVYILAPTCFGSSVPSSGNFLDPSELL